MSSSLAWDLDSIDIQDSVEKMIAVLFKALMA